MNVDEFKFKYQFLLYVQVANRTMYETSKSAITTRVRLDDSFSNFSMLCLTDDLSRVTSD